jgi:hypothetical protein
MDDATRLGFEFAKEVATQLITLSTGLLTLTITFSKEVFRTPPATGRRMLPFAWTTHVVSLGFGVLTLMALTGTLMPIDPATRRLTFDTNVRVIAALQILTFGLGTAFLVIYSVRSFSAKGLATRHRTVLAVTGELEQVIRRELTDGWELLQVVPKDADTMLVLLTKNSA